MVRAGPAGPPDWYLPAARGGTVMPGEDAAPAPGGLAPVGGPGDCRAWVRVASTLLDRIARGEYSGRLPGRAALTAEFRVTARTVQRALTELARRDVIYRVPGLGYHLRADLGSGTCGARLLDLAWAACWAGIIAE